MAPILLTEIQIRKSFLLCLYFHRFGVILNYFRLKKSKQMWETCLPKDPDRLALLTQEVCPNNNVPLYSLQAEYFSCYPLKDQAILLLQACSEKADATYVAEVYPSISPTPNLSVTRFWPKVQVVPKDLTRFWAMIKYISILWIRNKYLNKKHTCLRGSAKINGNPNWSGCSCHYLNSTITHLCSVHINIHYKQKCS